MSQFRTIIPGEGSYYGGVNVLLPRSKIENYNIVWMMQYINVIFWDMVPTTCFLGVSKVSIQYVKNN